MINTEFVKEMRNELDMFEMYQHELEMAEKEGDEEDVSYFTEQLYEEDGKIHNLFYNLTSSLYPMDFFCIRIVLY